MPPATPQDSSIVRGYRGIRELLGVRMTTVLAMARYDASRDMPAIVRVGSDGRSTVRATASDIWTLFREFEAARNTEERPAQRVPAQER